MTFSPRLKVGRRTPSRFMPSGEYSTVGMVRTRATKNLLRMSRSMVAAMLGSDMSWSAWSP
jgi:hypothetical protein